jgi:flagellar hook-associated protein 3 FlgL
MSNGISATGFFTSDTSLMLNSETQLNTLSQQLNTGLISTSLAGYGTAAPTILNLTDTVGETQAFIANGTEVNTSLTAYDTSLSELGSDASQLGTALSQVSPADPNSITTMQALITGLQADVGATLNSQVGNTYLYSGTRYNTQPVVDLTKLAPPAVPAAFVAVVPNTVALASPPNPVDTFNSPLPTYDTQSPAVDPNNQAYASQTLNVSPTQTVTYGITSNDPSIQALVYAMQEAQAGTNATGATQTQFFANANSALQTAISGIQNLQQQNDNNEVVIKDQQSVQTQTISNLQSQLGNLQNVDATTVATELTNVENQLDASFKATSTILNLSILQDL